MYYKIIFELAFLKLSLGTRIFATV
jgi:hypothetical protein